MTTLFRLCEMAALIGIFMATYQIAQAIHDAEVQLTQTVATVDATLARAQLALTSAQSTAESVPTILDRHLTILQTSLQYQTSLTRADLNHQLDLTRQSITSEIAPISSHTVEMLSATTETVNQTRESLIPALQSVQKASDDFPDLIRDLRFTAARSARTMGHVEQMSDAIAAATPAMTATTAKTSKELSGIATDIHKVTSRVTGPKPWYRKVWSVIQTGASASHFIF